MDELAVALNLAPVYELDNHALVGSELFLGAYLRAGIRDFGTTHTTAMAGNI